MNKRNIKPTLCDKQTRTWVSELKKIAANGDLATILLDAVQPAVRFEAATSNAFPARDLSVRLTNNDSQALSTIVCHFLTLYGADSPLPGYLNELCLAQGDAAQALRDFLNIIQHRLYALFALSHAALQPEWQKSHHHPLMHLAENHYALGNHALRSAHIVSTKHGWQAWLKERFRPHVVCIDDNIASWVRLDSNGTDNHALGQDIVLGQRLWVRSNACISIKIMTLAEVSETITRVSQSMARLNELSGCMLSWRLFWRGQSQDVTWLGNETMQLGINTALSVRAFSGELKRSFASINL